MKTYFPYQVKYIGVLFVFAAIILSAIGNFDDFLKGFNEGEKSVQKLYGTEFEKKTVNEPYFTTEEKKPIVNGSLALSILGFVLYLFSKEKAEDEFYQQLRGKCLTQALLWTWIFTGIIYWLIPELELEGFYILQLHLIFYTILYYHNKYNKYAIWN
jgi:hypothetical protein